MLISWFLNFGKKEAENHEPRQKFRAFGIFVFNDFNISRRGRTFDSACRGGPFSIHNEARALSVQLSAWQRSESSLDRARIAVVGPARRDSKTLRKPLHLQSDSEDGSRQLRLRRKLLQHLRRLSP